MALHLHDDATVLARQRDRIMWHVFPVPPISWDRFSCELSMAASKWDRAGGQRSWLISTTSDPPAVSMDQLTVTALNLTREKNSPTIVATGSFPSKQRQLTTTTARGPWQLRKFQIPHRQLTRSIEIHCVIPISLLWLSYVNYRYIRTSNHRKLGQKGGLFYMWLPTPGQSSLYVCSQLPSLDSRAFEHPRHALCPTLP